ncbi:hypothetical protein Marme_2102 [Marinomonas mediterranea MMB-1]|jgi:hypothetical protein|uniref:Uncharacterized protein n=1 Tax=Marinomonas mediterranea (strain ATCC 700492 / JCM 21426 / NBRC 103028 / MMB-1) TaxID=717774 RepID=F2K408_MARM1|nr:hypothetical protein Marme_2102 [Marinomonas mediterranea MMB-1]
MNDRVKYLLIQLFIFLLPGFFSVLYIEPNAYGLDFAETFLFHICGISGFLSLWLLLTLPAVFMNLVMSEVILIPISIVFCIVGATFIYMRLYKPIIKRIILISIVNLWLSIWSILIGQAIIFISGHA